MSNEKVFMNVENSIATIFINRPAKRNALSYEMWAKLNELVEHCDQDPDVKVMVFRSTTQKAFSAGADISEFKTLRSTVEGVTKYNEVMSGLEEKISASLKPSIAMIQGFCVGGGCEIAVACDFRFSDESGQFGITPAKLGIVYNTPATKHLVDLVGPSHAKDILFTGRLLNAEEALRMGLINRVYPSVELEKEVYHYASLICQNSQISVRGTKRIINQVLHGASHDDEDIQQLIHESIATDDYKEGVRAFLEKRKANFTYK